eukprot:Protomagalhaensia_wolfi_Nauph_80__4539@NODE_4663_length_528_cov_238_492843_g3435_i1_p1_GENE_NODE_4663_length_528_cov_238_492843_g3435_i1NODE_4663_length_528_cov_238_492843_g3435_i1_p1_ORF_typecomplete_len132_score10_75_NODE_4663_length_528_cov_238_492843_g3435_i163458
MDWNSFFPQRCPSSDDQRRHRNAQSNNRSVDWSTVQEGLALATDVLTLANRLRNLYHAHVEFRNSRSGSLRADFEHQYGPLSSPDWVDDEEEEEFLQFLMATVPGTRFDCPITRVSKATCVLSMRMLVMLM